MDRKINIDWNKFYLPIGKYSALEIIWPWKYSFKINNIFGEKIFKIDLSTYFQYIKYDGVLEIKSKLPYVATRCFNLSILGLQICLFIAKEK